MGATNMPEFTEAELAEMQCDNNKFHAEQDLHTNQRRQIEVLIALGIPCHDIDPEAQRFALFFLMDSIINDPAIEDKLSLDLDLLNVVRNLSPEEKTAVRRRIGR
jgi:hypothetical protein